MLPHIILRRTYFVKRWVLYVGFISFYQVALASRRIFSYSFIQHEILYGTSKYSPRHKHHLGEDDKTNKPIFWRSIHYEQTSAGRVNYHIEGFHMSSQTTMLEEKCSKMMQRRSPNDLNELLQREVDNGFHDVAARPAIPLHHFSSNMDPEWRDCKPSIVKKDRIRASFKENSTHWWF